MKRRRGFSRAVTVCSFLIITLASSMAYAGELLGTEVYRGALGRIDRDTAAWSEIGPTGVPVMGMAYDWNHDVLYGISPTTDNVYRIDRQTGQATRIGAAGALGYGNANGLAYDPVSDILYGTDNNVNELFTVDTVTGVGIRVATISGGFTEIEGLGFDASQGILYGLTQLQRRIVSIDAQSGVAQAVSGELPDLVWRGLDYDPEYRVLFASAVQIFGNARIYTFDPVGGRLDYRGDTIGAEAVQGLAYVPEPSGALLCAAMVPLLAVRRRLRPHV